MADHAHAHRDTTHRTFTIQEVIADATRRIYAAGTSLSTLLIVLLVLAAVGLVSMVIVAVTEGLGTDSITSWGYTGVAFGFLLSTVMATPCLAVLLRLTRSDWHRPLTRIAEVPVTAGILVLLLFIPLAFVIPSSEDRITFWTVWPWGSPWFFSLLMLLLLVGSGWAFLYLSAMPDMAIARDHMPGNEQRRAWYTKLARDWRGTLHQWKVLRLGLGVLGALYLILYIWVLTMIYTDYAQMLVPSWRSAVFPAFIVISSLQAGAALVTVMMYALRRWGGMEEYLTWDYFWAISKILLAASLLWFYLWFSEFMIFWYGRLPGQINVLKLVMFDVYAIPMLLAFTGCFLIPLFTLMWNNARKTVLGPTLVSVAILIGTLFDRVRVFGAAYGGNDLYAHELETEHIPGFLMPNLWDILIVAGSISAAALIIILAMRFVPLPSIWEFGSGIGLRVRKRFLNTEVTIIAKPE